MSDAVTGPGVPQQVSVTAPAARSSTDTHACRTR